MALHTDKPGLALVVDNNVTAKGFLGQWGLCQAIMPGDGSVWLMDAGSGGAVLPNLETLGIDPGAVRGIILSHGHWDHADGLADLFKAGCRARVYAHPDFGMARYSRRPGTPGYYAGVARELVPEIESRLEPVPDTAEPLPGLKLFFGIERLTGNEQPGITGPKASLFIDREYSRPDSLPDDGFALMDTPRGPVAVMGCCHSGLANSLAHLRNKTGVSELYALVGGTHLGASSPEGLDQAVAVLEDFKVQRILPCHCTGQEAWGFLRQRLGERVEPAGAGAVLSLA